MRIVAGRHRGRVLRVPDVVGVRPTADRVRESLFNILDHGIDWPGIAGAGVIDGFAGTGACGLEALSRGAAQVTFLDTSADALLAIRRNAASLGEIANAVLLKLDASRLPPPPRVIKAPASLALLDPPYDSGLAVPALQGLVLRGWMASGAIAVVEVAVREPLAVPFAWAMIDERVYGAARLVFLRAKAPTGEAGAAGTLPAGEPTSAGSSDRG
ncbi:MAG: 16S rRNA (guanine(966)-N(2))-methyltransferase RsmD [Rhodospirillales bacterium]|nr:16S rRNA (guanine(966)-N(2))-methyltransferase RsmD [Rhodospirillales bacterium]